MARKTTTLALALLLSTGCAHLDDKAWRHLDKGDTFSGRVTDQEGSPVDEARIAVGGAETRSRGDGSFRLKVPRAERYLLNITHPDYADLSHLSRQPLSGQTWELVRAQVETVDPSGPIVLVDSRPELAVTGLGGATLELAPDSLVDDQGQPPAGMVRASIATLDVANGEGPREWAVRADDGTEGFLVSYGAVFVQFTDPSGGAAYQLRSGRTADLSLPVLPSMRTHTPPGGQAPFWYYDETEGYWKQNGTSVFDPVTESYVGQVDHLSTINTDIAKFNDAACLKITLDPSIDTGKTLRIRYHSGGTPFGQTPSFVLDATDNAAYRLPANTNVLLELIDGGNVIGNLVVEDPPGSALVNTVVNTGPPIPAGNSLWPPAPYADCKPIVLTLGMPEVEIRINELPADAAREDDPTDDYLTWAPTFGRARLVTPIGPPNVTVVLTNDAPGAITDGGDVVFAPYQDPWPVDTTAAADTVTLVLPSDGSWVPFVVAGKHGSPSHNDKDTIIEAHRNNPNGPVLGTKALMVRIRKDANSLTDSERDRFLFAWRAFRNRVGNNYVLFQELHRLASGAGDEAHMQPAFLTWHRALLLQVERELQAIDPSVALHYWNWDAAAPNVFSDDFMGAPGNDPMDFIAEPVFSITNPLNGWNTDLPFNSGELRRSEADHTVDPGGAMKPLDEAGSDLLDFDDFGPTAEWPGAIVSFSGDVERESHNPAHGWPCASGHLTSPNRSAADPLFYLLHSQIDRQWAYWQREYDRFGTVVGNTLTFPAPAHYDNNGAFDDPSNDPDPNGNSPHWTFRQQGSYLDDGLWPWDGTSGGVAMTVEWRPPNQAVAAGPNVPVSMPMIPMTDFPASPRPNLWPPVATVPTNAHMIDYLGKFRPQDGLGFSYDDVPY